MSSSEIQVSDWETRDAEYEAAFALPNSWRSIIASNIRKLFHRPSTLPSLNAYRDHILRGLDVGQLPVDGNPIDGFTSRQMLESEDFDQTAGRGNPKHRSIISSEELRVFFSKMRIDLMSGKMPLFAPDSTEEPVTSESEVE